MSLSAPRPLPRTQALAGIGCAVLGAACFATKGVFAKFLYAHGWDPATVLVTRSVLALPLIAAWALSRLKPGALRAAPRGALAGAAAAGAACYGVGSSLDFYALASIDVGVERVLLYAYPTMVVALYALLQRRLPRPRVLGALLVTYTGILLVVSGFDMSVFSRNLGGSGLVLACAFTMALYFLASDRWTGALGAGLFTMCGSAAATLCLVVDYLLRHGVASSAWHSRDAGLVAGLVLFATVVPMLALAESVRLLGAERAALVSTVGPPTTLLLGAWLFGERLRTAQWLGVALIVAGILILEVVRSPAARAVQSAAADGSAADLR